MKLRNTDKTNVINRMYNKLETDKTKEIMSQIGSLTHERLMTLDRMVLPSELIGTWIKTTDSVYLHLRQIDAPSLVTNQFGIDVFVMLPKPIPVRCMERVAYMSPIFNLHEINCASLTELVVRHQVILQQLDDIKQSMKSIIFACNTTKQLFDILPEAKDFMPELQEPIKDFMIPMSDINRIRNLFRKETA